MKTSSEFNDLEEMAKRGYLTILLDENLRGLKSALADDGFKVVLPHARMDDDAIKEEARGWVI